MTTLKDIAALAGVSIGTVSTVLNGSQNTIKVRKETSKRVLDAAQKLKYTPNLNAKALKMDRSFVIGVMVTQIVGSFIPEILEGIEDFLMTNNYSMLLSVFNNESEFINKCQVLKQKRVEGVIVICGNTGLNKIYASSGIGLPLVGTGYTVELEDGVYVKVDGEKIGYTATRHLLELGHRDIAFLSHGHYYEDRINGWRHALNEYNVPENKQLVLYGGAGYDGGKEMFRQIMQLKKMPTALVAHSDELAAGAMNEAFTHGFKVPEDISIIGTDNKPLAEMLRPGLTTVEQPKREQGRIAAELINALLNKKKPASVLLEPVLIERKSCGIYINQNNEPKKGTVV
jgi:DNA-binding LacI/PurR family transcriptional regulator